MKKWLFIGLLTTQAMAGERVLISDSKVADVTLNKTSVRCSALGYGMAELKINIPALDGWTLFDHSNINLGDFGGEPCMTAGSCKRGTVKRPGNTGFSVEDILGNIENTQVSRILIKRKIVEVKDLGKDEQGNDVCLRHIQERLETDVPRADGNGLIHFSHLRHGLHETFPAKVCQ